MDIRLILLRDNLEAAGKGMGFIVKENPTTIVVMVVKVLPVLVQMVETPVIPAMLAKVEVVEPLAM